MEDLIIVLIVPFKALHPINVLSVEEEKYLTLDLIWFQTLGVSGLRFLTVTRLTKQLVIVLNVMIIFEHTI